MPTQSSCAGAGTELGKHGLNFFSETNHSGPFVNSQGWFNKLEMASMVLSLGGGGGEMSKLMLTQSSCAET